MSGKESPRLVHSGVSEQDQGSAAALRGSGIEGSYLRHRMLLRGHVNHVGTHVPLKAAVMGCSQHAAVPPSITVQLGTA